MTVAPILSPFAVALGPSMVRVAPVIRKHLALEEPVFYKGIVRRLWWRGAFVLRCALYASG